MLKKIWAFVLAAAVAVGYIGATGSMEVYAGENNIVASLNAGFNEAGNDRVPYWWYGSSADITVVEDETAPEGGRCVKVTPQASGAWIGCAVNATDVLEDGVTYEYSFYVKLDADCEEKGTTVVKPVINRIFTEDYSDTDQNTQVNQAEANLSRENWTKVTGSFTIDYNPSGRKEAVMQHFILNGNGTGTFYIDDLSIVKIVKAPVIIEDIVPLKEHFGQNSTIAGKAGVAIPASALTDDARMELVKKHYNSITCENEMKPDVFLGNEPTYKTDNSGSIVVTDTGEPALQLNFEPADAIMDYIKNYNTANPDDVIKVRGHVLVWHSQTPDWFFREGYSSDGAYVSKEKMLGRMKNYIKEVMEHYDSSSSPYQGMIYAWDVVNEQIETADYDTASNPASLRFYCNGEKTGWYNVFHGDSSYITQAFVYANQYAPSDVKLFYNDYGETDPAKREAVCGLLQEIKDTPGARIDGMGMQAHYSMDTPSVTLIEEAVRKFSLVVNEVQFTELDLQSSKNYNGSDKEAELTKQGYRYKEIFETLCRLDGENGIDITAITIWGTHDGASWLQNTSSVGGGADGSRPQMPLLFDNDYKAKPAYWGIVDAAKLEPFINKISVRYSSKEVFEDVAPVTWQSSIGEIAFRALWNEEGLKVRIDVPDSSQNTADKVAVYIQEPGNAFVAERSKAKETETGYQAVVVVPEEKITNLSVGKKLAFDVAVFDNDVQMSWNDLTNSQESDNQYYGELIFKPYMEVPKGTPVIDGVCEKEWEKTEEEPLAILIGSPKATGTVRAMWDNEYLYVYFKVEDSDVSKASGNAYEQDSVEVFVDQNNGKSGSYEEDDGQYRINFDNETSFNGANCKAENLWSAAQRTDTGYAVELGIKWIGDAPKAGNFLGLEFQINDGASDGSRIGTISWYDENGTGYQDPSVFGTVKLVEVLEKKNDIEDEADMNVFFAGIFGIIVVGGGILMCRKRKIFSTKLF